ncbi:MAG: hypothetical protein ABI222_11545 [Opitutaceae bacterium]
MKQFADIFTGRVQHAGWSTIQASTLLEEAKLRHCSSLLVYAALELRLAIEQLMFTLVIVAKGKADQPTLRACSRPGGLFQVLESVTPQYVLKCRFSAMLVEFHPEIPQGAEWDIAALRRYHAAVSDFCHAHRAIRGMGRIPELWDERVAILREVHDFLVTGLQKDTAVLSFKGATPQVLTLWRNYSGGKVTLKEVRRRFAMVKPLLVNRPSRAHAARDRAPSKRK